MASEPKIAAQLSQALFTMADLHAQVSDLREENRQLKIKIESIDIQTPQEDVSAIRRPLAKKATLDPSPIPIISSNSTSIQKDFDHPPGTFKQELQLINPVETPINREVDGAEEKVDLNGPLKQISDERAGEASDATLSHSGGDLKCEKCECAFPNSDLLTTHQAVHFGRSFHICKVCNAMFLLKADLYRHWTTHPNIKQHVCQLCGKAYTSKNNYKLHVKTHTGEGLYPCEVCGKAFHSENHLNVHRRIHTGERPFECQYCEKSFTQKSGLINHTRLHTGEKPFLCPSCPKAFTQKSNLNFHLSKHHPVPGNISSN
ncbi:zinc finger protein 383-like isoform X2 [Thrips palmi]|uniref:Zinc finger protein 383-like isoform X2 n=1 Tax=Thrips palmi TaxID=161013 RepID=A0A6P9A7W8_THRPL|nr:zinc finger protein 383-like isoform X2 [Thrips palmi]XP_034254037.1 zinc finger protein 383-like isoform X2 [Thrips palmi]XP_034254038.1 zinc finger protein 383-like isoform X2 [Thrips palmi]